MYYTPEEVAAMLKVAKTTVWGWIRENKIEHLELPGRKYRITQEAIDKFIKH